ncbi:MAG: lysophospholipid acyltransferase family protein [Proteobacteria bacterium]|nr:lysophospholipid acyltransferase family protein [Pseudomonadota bacterium]
MKHIQVILIRAVLYIFQRIPENTALSFGKKLGLFWFHVIRYRRSLVIDNLRKAFSQEKSEAEILRLARDNFIHYGIYLVEFLRLPGLDRDDLEKRIKILDTSHIEKALLKGKGLIVICGHYGNFDLMAIAQSIAGFDTYIITKKIRNKSINEYWQKIREDKGVKFLPKKKSLFAILRLLKQNKIIGMIFDQHMGGNKGVNVNFFNRPASTMKAVAMIAVKTGTPVVPVFNWREDGIHYLTSGPEIPLVTGSTKDETVLFSTQKFNDVIEAFIRQHPEQWIWVHKRWK